MTPLTAFILFLLFVVGMVFTAYEMNEALKPPRCPRCSHCEAEMEAEKRRQQELAREWEESRRRLTAPGADGEGKPKCDLPPDGWRCTRDAGHDGPCAAVPEKPGGWIV